MKTIIYLLQIRAFRYTMDVGLFTWAFTTVSPALAGRSKTRHNWFVEVSIVDADQ